MVPVGQVPCHSTLRSRSKGATHARGVHPRPPHPSFLRSLVLLDKTERRKVDYVPDYIGFPVSGAPRGGRTPAAAAAALSEPRSAHS